MTWMTITSNKLTNITAHCTNQLSIHNMTIHKHTIETQQEANIVINSTDESRTVNTPVSELIRRSILNLSFNELVGNYCNGIQLGWYLLEHITSVSVPVYNSVYNCSNTIRLPVPPSIESNNFYDKFNIDKNINKVNSYFRVSSLVLISHAVVNKSNSTLDVVLQSRCETFKVHSDYLNHTILPVRPPLGDIPHKLILYDDLNIKTRRKTERDSEYNPIETLMHINSSKIATRISNKHIERSSQINQTQNTTPLHQQTTFLQQQYTHTQRTSNTRHQTCKDMYKTDP